MMTYRLPRVVVAFATRSRFPVPCPRCRGTASTVEVETVDGDVLDVCPVCRWCST